MKTHLFRTVGLALALGTLSGCGSTALMQASALGLDSLLQARGTGLAELRDGQATGGPRGDEMRGARREGKGGPGGKLHGEGPMGEERLFEGLALTDDQRAQLKAIAERHRPAKPAPEDTEKREHPGRKVQALLTAEVLDVEALEAALAEAPPAPPAPPAGGPGAPMAEVRAVLTAAQIDQLVARLEAMPAKPEARPERADKPARPDEATRLASLATRLNLNADQQAALQAFETAMAANRPAPPDEATRQATHEARHAAMIAFWKTGDASQLEALKPAPPERPAFPVDALVTLATSLTAEQRQQLFAKGPHGPGMKGLHRPGVAGAMGGRHRGGHDGLHGPLDAAPPSLN